MTWTANSPVPEGFVVPDGYEVTEQGVFHVREDRRTGETLRARITAAPFVPVSTYTAPDGSRLVELAWTYRGDWIVRQVPRSLITDGRALARHLGSDGGPITTSSAKAVEAWLSAAEADNWPKLPDRTAAAWLGWQPDGRFVASPSDDVLVWTGKPKLDKAAAAHHSAGTLAEWQVAVKPLGNYPVAAFVLQASFAAPLIDLVGAPSGMIELAGRSSTGKTTAANAAFSVWGQPGKRSDAYMHWGVKSVAPLEERLSILRGVPVVIDEGQLASPEIAHTMIYQVEQGRGIYRAGDWDSGMEWSTIVITTGESSLLDATTAQGAAPRVVSVTRFPFGNGPRSGQDADDVADGVASHYGTAGPAFAERLQQELRDPRWLQWLRGAYGDYRAAMSGDTALSRRRAKLLAAIALGGELAYAWGISPVPPLPCEELVAIASNSVSHDDKGQLALDAVRDYLAARPNSVWAPGDDYQTTPTGPEGWLARHVEVDGQMTVAATATALKSILQRCGYSWPEVRGSWQDPSSTVLVRWLSDDEARKKKRDPWTKLLALAGSSSKPRMYVFRPEAWNAVEDSDRL